MQADTKLRVLSSYFNIYFRKSFSFLKNNTILILLFSAFFIFYTYENIFFANSFKFIPLREVNELAFQISMREFYLDLVNLNIFSLLRSNDYGYGFIFWTIYGLLVSPFYFLLINFPNLNYFSVFEKLIIFLPRELSLIFTIIGLIKWTRILNLISKNRILVITSFSVILLSSPLISYSATNLHTTSLLFLFSSYFFSFFVKLFSSTASIKSDFFKMTLFLVLAIAVKLNGILLLPFYFSVIIILFKRNGSRIVNILGARFLVIPLILNMSLSPLVLYDLINSGNSNFIDEVTGQLGNKLTPIGLSFSTRFIYGIDGYIFSKFNLFVLFCFLLLYFMYVTTNKLIKDKDFKIFILIAFNFFFSYSLLVFVVRDSSFSLSNYAMPIYPFLLVLLVLSLSFFPPRLMNFVLILFTSTNLILNYSNFYYRNSNEVDSRNLPIRPINYFQSLGTSSKFILEYDAFLKFKNTGIGDLQSAKSILLDYRALIPINPLTTDANFVYTFDNEDRYINNLLNLEYDRVILSNKSLGQKKLQVDPSCTSFKNPTEFNLCNLRRILLLENMCNGPYCYKVVYFDTSVYILKKSNSNL